MNTFNNPVYIRTLSTYKLIKMLIKTTILILINFFTFYFIYIICIKLIVIKNILFYIIYVYILYSFIKASLFILNKNNQEYFKKKEESILSQKIKNNENYRIYDFIIDIYTHNKKINFTSLIICAFFVPFVYISTLIQRMFLYISIEFILYDIIESCLTGKEEKKIIYKSKYEIIPYRFSIKEMLYISYIEYSYLYSYLIIYMYINNKKKIIDRKSMENFIEKISFVQLSGWSFNLYLKISWVYELIENIILETNWKKKYILAYPIVFIEELIEKLSLFINLTLSELHNSTKKHKIIIKNYEIILNPLNRKFLDFSQNKVMKDVVKTLLTNEEIADILKKNISMINQKKPRNFTEMVNWLSFKNIIFKEKEHLSTELALKNLREGKMNNQLHSIANIFTSKRLKIDGCNGGKQKEVDLFQKKYGQPIDKDGKYIEKFAYLSAIMKPDLTVIKNFAILRSYGVYSLTDLICWRMLEDIRINRQLDIVINKDIILLQSNKSNYKDVVSYSQLIKENKLHPNTLAYLCEFYPLIKEQIKNAISIELKKNLKKIEDEIKEIEERIPLEQNIIKKEVLNIEMEEMKKILEEYNTTDPKETINILIENFHINLDLKSPIDIMVDIREILSMQDFNIDEINKNILPWEFWEEPK